MQILFNLQHITPNEQVLYAAFHLTDAAQLWYIKAVQEIPPADWEAFKEALVHDFGHLKHRQTEHELAPPPFTGSVNDYIDDFVAYIARIGLNSMPHQVNLLISGLPAHLRDMMTA